MIPPAHAGLGYFVYSLWTRLSDRKPPAHIPTFLLLLGTQIPDIVDKPLYVLFGVYHGRAIMHSFLVVVPVGVLAVSVADRYGQRRSGTAFTIGMFTHLLSDAAVSVYRGKTHELGFLAWPLTSPPVYSAPNPLDHLWWLLRDLRSLLHRPPSQLFGDLLFLELLFSVGVFMLWMWDGQPVVRPFWRWTVDQLGK